MLNPHPFKQPWLNSYIGSVETDLKVAWALLFFLVKEKLKNKSQYYNPFLDHEFCLHRRSDSAMCPPLRDNPLL